MIGAATLAKACPTSSSTALLHARQRGICHTLEHEPRCCGMAVASCGFGLLLFVRASLVPGQWLAYAAGRLGATTIVAEGERLTQAEIFNCSSMTPCTLATSHGRRPGDRRHFRTTSKTSGSRSMKGRSRSSRGSSLLPIIAASAEPGTAQRVDTVVMNVVPPTFIDNVITSDRGFFSIVASSR